MDSRVRTPLRKPRHYYGPHQSLGEATADGVPSAVAKSESAGAAEEGRDHCRREGADGVAEHPGQPPHPPPSALNSKACFLQVLLAVAKQTEACGDTCHGHLHLMRPLQ